MKSVLLSPSTRRRRSFFPLLTLAGLVLFVAPAACDSTPELVAEEGSPCEKDDDCGDGLACTFDGTCRNKCSSQDDCGSGEFCSTDGTCKDQCPSCGSACDSTSDCPTGQFCLEGSCQQECEPGTRDDVCGERVCSDDGECIGDSDIVIGNGGQGGMSGMGGDPNKDCIDVEVDFEPQIPNVVLLIDQSGSMTANNFGGAVDDAITAGTYEAWDCGDDYDWRWNVVRNVLLHPDNGVVKPLEDDVRFGLSLYSSEGGTAGGTCPMLTDVDLAFGTHQEMLDSMDCSDLITDTPTRESLTATAEALAAMEVDGPKVIVLATDGLPDNCECANWNAEDGRPQTCCPNSSNDPGNSCFMAPNNDVTVDGMDLEIDEYEQYLVVQEAERINQELGIQIEVINVSSPGAMALANHLDDVAERGGAVGGASIDGFDPAALSDAFQSIIDGVRSCAIDLDGEIEEGKESTGTVTLDGEELLLDDPDGWIVNSPTQIELVGEACETIKTGEHDLDITFPCGSFNPVILK